MRQAWSKRRNRVLALLLACLALAGAASAAGGTLARPEREGQGADKFVGFHLVLEPENRYVDMDDPDWEEGLEARPAGERSGWEAAGTQEVQTDTLGALSIPREILIGQYDEETGRYVFPGMEGLNCFLAIRTEQGEEYYSGYSDMEEVHLSIGDEETTLSGTVYYGPPLDSTSWDSGDYDCCWTAYRVYQMADGTIYLDGSGSSFGGAGGFAVSSKESDTKTVNGESKTVSFQVEFTMTSVERVETVEVAWFDADDQMVGRRTLTMEEIGEGLALARPEGAVWALAAQTDRLGQMERTVYTLEPEGAAHRLIQLDERGVGRAIYLTLEG